MKMIFTLRRQFPGKGSVRGADDDDDDNDDDDDAAADDDDEEEKALNTASRQLRFKKRL
jgi:hypothetical protein